MRVFLVLLVVMITGCATAWADTLSVYVDPVIPNAPAITARIVNQLTSDDTISVQVLTDHSVAPPSEGDIVIVAIGTDVRIVSATLPRATADEILTRAGSVAIDPIDRIVVTIRAIHAWQQAHPRPLPPPSPTNWGPWLWPTTILVIVAVLVGWLFRRIRHHQNYVAGLAARADEQQAKWDRGEISSIFEYKGDM